ncbi:hypothetical protein ACWGQ5_56695, partial [Streptomyces sp. NPDC055722]
RGSGEPQGPPNVYHPYPEATPEYEQYTDPAAAHGWQDAFDETQELPVSSDSPALPVPAPRGGSRRRARPAWRSRLPRGALVAAGALGAVGVAVALVGGFGSGSSGAPGDGGQSARPKTAPSASTTDGAASPVEPSGSADPAARTEASPTSPGASPSVSATEGGGATPPSAASSASPPSVSPSASASTTAPGNPGHGHGATKRPR